MHKKKIIVPVDYVFYFFPFKKEFEFSKMPKIKINLRKENEVLSSYNFIYHKELKYEKSKNKIRFKIKLADLNWPEYLFFSANIKVGGTNYDFVPWEIIKIEY